MGNEWNAMTYEGKDNILQVVRREAAQMMSLASDPGVWETQTASEEWEVRDVIGHLVDTTEGYFVSFDAARGSGSMGGGSRSGGSCRSPDRHRDRRRSGHSDRQRDGEARTGVPVNRVEQGIRTKVAGFTRCRRRRLRARVGAGRNGCQAS